MGDVSTIPAVLAHLVDAWKAADWPGPNPQVTYGDPGGDIEREHVWLDGTAPDQDWVHAGARELDESYELLGYIHVTRDGATQQEVTERAFALFSTLAGVVRADHQLAGKVVSALVTGRSYFAAPTAEGRMVLIEFGVKVQARI